MALVRWSSRETRHCAMETLLVAGSAAGSGLLVVWGWLRARSRAAEAAAGDEEDELPELPAKASPKNDLLVRAARGERTERVPVWAMRQAGRYLPEFRALRAKHEFFELCRTPKLAAEITLQPLRRFHGLLDAVVIFSDILVVPQAMGMECRLVPGVGPVFSRPLADPARDVGLLELDPPKEAFESLFAAIRETRRRMRDEVPVVGFCGGPWTLLAYMVEGRGSRTFSKSKTWLFQHPEESHRLLEALARCLVKLLVGQYKEGGASVLQVFESSAGELSPSAFREFSLPYMVKVAEGVRAELGGVREGGPPLIAFARGAHHALAGPLADAYDVLGVDWAFEPSEAARVVTGGEHGESERRAKALQGNLDPGVLYGTPERIRAAAKEMLRGFGGAPLIANLGWGMHPTHRPEALEAFFRAVHEESTRMRASP